MLRLRDVSGIERDLIDLATRHDRLNADVETMKALLEIVAGPGLGPRCRRPPDFRQLRLCPRGRSRRRWRRGRRANWNYSDRSARDESFRARSAGGTFAKRLPAIVAGERRIFDVVDAPSGSGSAGIAIDRTEAETMRSSWRA